MKTKFSVVFIAVLALLVPGHLPSAKSAGTASREGDPRIVSKLAEIVSIRERLAARDAEMVAAGRAPADSRAELELADARIELARERGQREMVIKELEALVAAHERRAKRIGALSKDRTTPGEAERAQAGLLEAQVRLLRVQR